MAKKEDFDWASIFEGVEWFHFTGITPALSDEVAAICVDACKAAKERNTALVCLGSLYMYAEIHEFLK
jgi:2-dehydro-3-deoxygluconokinase